MIKRFLPCCTILIAAALQSHSQTLQSVTDNGSVTSNPITISSAVTNNPNLTGSDLPYNHLLFTSGQNFSIAKIAAYLPPNHYQDRGGLLFYTNGDGSLTPKLAIHANGNVGIGTTLPQANIHIAAGTSSFETATALIEGLNGAASEIILKGGDASNNRRSAIRFFSNNLSTGTSQWILGSSMNQTNGDSGFYFNDAANSTSLYLKQGGNVGIGTTNPTARLTVAGGAMSTGLSDISTTLTARFNTANPPITLGVGYVSSDNPFMQAFNSVNSTANSLIFNPFGGNVGIGTTSPDQKLTVNGKIHTLEVIVESTVPTPDYVFKKDYALRPLKDVEAYIEKNSHLPEIPSAAEVKEKGLAVGEMNMLLLKKIEELTLYMIQKDREVEELKGRLKKIENKH